MYILRNYLYSLVDWWIAIANSLVCIYAINILCVRRNENVPKGLAIEIITLQSERRNIIKRITTAFTTLTKAASLNLVLVHDSRSMSQENMLHTMVRMVFHNSHFVQCAQ